MPGSPTPPTTRSPSTTPPERVGRRWWCRRNEQRVCHGADDARTRGTARSRRCRRWDDAARRMRFGYHRQPRVEKGFFRYKRIIGGRLRARSPKSQPVEASVACNILNRRRSDPDPPVGRARCRWVPSHAPTPRRGLDVVQVAPMGLTRSVHFKAPRSARFRPRSVRLVA